MTVLKWRPSGDENSHLFWKNKDLRLSGSISFAVNRTFALILIGLSEQKMRLPATVMKTLRSKRFNAS
jgi:hypothetical protein